MIEIAGRSLSELSSGEQAHLFTRGLTLAHLDARGVEAIAYQPRPQTLASG